MTKTSTSRYDVSEHLRTPEEMTTYLEACLDEADGDAAFIAKALGDIARAKGLTQATRRDDPQRGGRAARRAVGMALKTGTGDIH